MTGLLKKSFLYFNTSHSSKHLVRLSNQKGACAEKLCLIKKQCFTLGSSVLLPRGSSSRERTTRTDRDNSDDVLYRKRSSAEDGAGFAGKTNESTHQLLREASRTSHEEFVPEFPSDFQQPGLKWKSHNDWARDQTKHAFRPKINPQSTSIILFPGQGSQYVGMAEKLLPYPNVKEMFEVARNILGCDLLDICLNGPKAKLDKTQYCQPAVFVTSLAAIEKLKDETPKAIENCTATAGFSVGEYAALVFSGAMEFEDALQVVKVRAEAMQRASEEIPSAMMTLFLGADSKEKKACQVALLYCKEELKIENPVCQIANYLSPDCKVIAGHSQALSFIEKNAKHFGIRRHKYLPVSGAFHTPLMASACTPLQNALRHCKVQTPLIGVHSNVNSYKYKQEKFIKKLLVQQVVKPVKWEQTMHVLYSRPDGDTFPYTYEMGPGRQLGALLKLVNRKGFQQYSAVEV